jgi:proteasome lid subunit RPN8/RPN11
MKPLFCGIRLTPSHWEAMQADVISRVGEEACGLVLGEGNASRMIVPVENIYHDPFKFRMDPEQELQAFMLAEQRGWEILAIYHSHPHGISQPSHSDFDELTFPGVIYFIWYQAEGQWQCRAYLMKSYLSSQEVPIIIATAE